MDPCVLIIAVRLLQSVHLLHLKKKSLVLNKRVCHLCLESLPDDRQVKKQNAEHSRRVFVTHRTREDRVQVPTEGLNWRHRGRRSELLSALALPETCAGFLNGLRTLWLHAVISTERSHLS